MDLNNGGIIQKNVTYSLSKNSLTLLVCLNKDIDDIYDEKLEISETFDMLKGDFGSLSYSGSKCVEFTDKLSKK